MAVVINLNQSYRTDTKMETGSNALAATNRAVGLSDGYDAWKRDVTTYQESKKNF